MPHGEEGVKKRLAEVAAIDVRHVQRIKAGRANAGISTPCQLAGALGTTAAGLIAVDEEGGRHPA